MEISPQKTIQPEGGIGGDNRNPVYLRYGGDITVRQNAAVSPNYELWEESIGKVAEVGYNGKITEVGTFPQWQKLIFYLFKPSTNQKYYPLITSSSIVGVDYESGWLEFHPSYIPGDPLPWDADFVWTVFIDADYSLAVMPPPEILDEVDNPFQPSSELSIPFPGNLYAVVTRVAAQDDALWLEKPSTQLIMGELGSHIEDTLFFGQMNVGDTLRFFLRSPNSIVSGMNLYPRISALEQMMYNGDILMCRLEFEDWTDLLFDDVSIDIYLQPDSGAYAGPIAIFFEPEKIGPGDTTTITFKRRYLDGTLENIDSSMTFEVGLIDGCTLGILKTETDSGVYIAEAYQPMYFIADSSADSGTMMVRAGLIENVASKMIRGNIEQEHSTETKTAKRYDVFIKKSTPNAYTNKNNNEVLGDNPGSEFCQLEYYTQDFGVGSLVLGNECGAGAPKCVVQMDAPLGIASKVEYKKKYNKPGFFERDLCKITTGSGFTWIRYDGWTTLREDHNPFNYIPVKDEFYSPYNIETCFNEDLNNTKGAYQFKLKTINGHEDSIYINYIISECDKFDRPISSVEQLSSIPLDSICKVLQDFELGRYYDAEIGEEVPNIWVRYNVLYSIIDVIYEHEKYHVRDATRYANEIYDKAKLTVIGSDGYFVTKTLKEYIEAELICSKFVKNYDEAKQKGEKYIKNALKEFMNFHMETWYAGTVQRNFEGEKIYRIKELFAHWSNRVQNKITKYQDILQSREGFNVKTCDFKIKNWDTFKIYRNDL